MIWLDGSELKACTPRGVAKSCFEMGAHVMVADRRTREDYD
jgi:hypothetical protein